MAPAEDPARLRVSVVFSPRAGAVDSVDLLLDPGATVADALAASGLQARHPGVDLSALTTGLWGALCERGDLLRDRDRVELYRPLRVDPKEARRQRHQAQRGSRR
jgi:putative ubiquitin-RnfH superfamily antitoxin RatB of RatAB toxin-antitoxin module